MEKNPDQWNEISNLINQDKKRALDHFRNLEFHPTPAPEIRLNERLLQWFAGYPAIPAVAASLLLAIGLVSFWLLRGSWQKVPAAPAWNEILADSFFYSGYGRPDTESATEPSAASPIFTAWAEAGLERTRIAVGAVDPSAPVEHGDPNEVRQRIGRAIHEGAFEQLLIHFQEIHDKEA
jgi:hypothetical protein